MSNKEEKILSAALLLFTQQGFHAAPTVKIAKQAGVSNGTLFHYFPNKESLILALYRNAKDQLHAQLFKDFEQNNTLPAKMRHLYVQSLIWAQAHPQEFKYIQQFQTSPYLELISDEEQQRYARGYMQLLRDAVEQGLVIDKPIDYLLTLMGSLTLGVNQYLGTQKRSQQEIQDIANDSFDLMWKMVS